MLIFGMGYNNYDHHVGCKMTNKYDSANNSLNFYYTFLSFNEGYHVAIHFNPGLHWSRLPQLSRRSRAKPGNSVLLAS